MLLVDKPAGRHLARRRRPVRRERGVKAGHAGTLDPFATGLLIVLLGRAATRVQARFMALPKTYRATARFGAARPPAIPTASSPRPGACPARSSSCRPARSASAPPVYSAVKVGGERAYRRAHRGEEVEMPPRRSTVHRAELLGRDGERAEFEIECSSGTYVRSLIADLGDAYCERLRRTAIGPVRGRGGRRGSADRRSPTRWPAVSSRACESSRRDEHQGHPASRRRAAPAHVAIGTFDGVHVGHRAGDRGRRHRAHLRAAPARA